MKKTQNITKKRDINPEDYKRRDMEIIDKRHESIRSNTRSDISAYFKIESPKAVFFSAGTSHKFGLTPGLYVHFQNDGDRWYFYCNTDTDGFKLLNRPGKSSTIICDVSLVKLILKRTRCSIGTKFLITLTNAKLNGHHIMEINFNQPIG